MSSPQWTTVRTAWCWGLVAGLLAAMAAAARPGPDERFQRAAAAYDNAEFGQAISVYESLLTDGWVSPALLYNLGNAYYRAGEIGHAALQYRRAWRLAPRDGDIRGNLSHVLQESEALTPRQSPGTAMVQWVSAEEYARTGVAAYWLLAALFIASRFYRPLTPLLRPAAAGLGLVVLAGVLGGWSWVRLQADERVVVAPDQRALYAPLDDAQTHFALPPGSIVRQVDHAPPWVKIEVNGKSGWIRSAASARVLEETQQ